MKPILVRKRDSLAASIEFDGAEYDYFYNPLHYHPEFELTLIVKSFGQRRIGDNIDNFNKTFKKITGISPLQYRKRMKKFDTVQEL